MYYITIVVFCNTPINLSNQLCGLLTNLGLCIAPAIEWLASIVYQLYNASLRFWNWSHSVISWEGKSKWRGLFLDKILNTESIGA